MSQLLDTDILSLLERKSVPAKLLAWIAKQDDLFISIVTLAELEYGKKQAPLAHQESLAAWLKNVHSDFSQSIEPLSEAVLVRWKQLIAELKRKNRSMTCEDSLIAATALHHGYTVITRNVRHFEPCGVAVFNPLA